MPNRRSRKKLPILSLIVLLILAGLFAWRWGLPLLRALTVSPSEQYASQGDAFLADGRLPEAVLSYRQALEADPENSTARSALARAYAGQGRLRLAAQYGYTGQTNAGDALPFLWINADTAVPPTGAAVTADRIVVAYEDGTLKVLDRRSGAQVMQIQLPAAVTSAPAVQDDMAWVGAQDGSIYAIRLADGSTAWTFPSGGPIFAAPVFADGTLYCASSSGSLFALNAQTGVQKWKFTTRGALHAPPAVSGGRAVFGSHDARIYAVDAATGAPAWQDGILTGGAVESQPALVENRVIAGSGDGRVYALALDSGGQFWRVSTPDAVYAAPLVAGETVYIASSGSSLSAISLLSGEKLWQASLPGPLRNPPALAGDALYQIVDGDAGLYRVDTTSGSVTRLGSTGDWTAAGPWISGETLYLLGKDGAVLAYNLPD